VGPAHRLQYINFISSNLEAREAIAKVLGLPGVRVVDGILVYGLTGDDEAPIIAKLAAGRTPSVSVVHYDQVWMNLVEAFARA